MNSTPLYIGVDFHPHQQTVAWCDTETGETQTITLQHDVDKVRKFYQGLSPGVVGIEASCKAVWFENLLAQSDHQLRVGNPTLIRKRATSRHKSDTRDAELILELLLKGEFPAIWRRSFENNQILEILKLRLSFVRQRTQTYNRLQALAKKKPKPVAKMATARKLLVKLVIMWRDEITAQEFDRRGGGTVGDARLGQGLEMTV